MHTGDMQETARLTGVSLEDIENVLTKLGPDPIPRKVRGKRKNPLQRNPIHGSGELGQNLFEKYCSQLGISYTPAWRYRKYDYLVYGQKVEVKYCSIGNNTASFSANIGHFDILAVFLASMGIWIIIPKEALVEGRKSLTAPKVIEPESVYYKYINNFDLLKNYEKSTIT